MKQQQDIGIVEIHGRTSPDLQKGLEYFSSVEWTRKIIENHEYKPTAISFRENILGPREDTYFGATMKTPQTVSHWICLLHRKFPNNVKGRTLTNGSFDLSLPPPSSSIDCIFLIRLGTGLWGFRDTMHGGAICSILDQTMSLCAGAHRNTVPDVGGHLHTATLQVDFRRPILVPEIVLVECWLEYRDGRKWMIKGRIKDASGAILAESKGLWVLTKPEKL